MSNPRASIIILTYNRLDSLRESLRCLSPIRYRPLEIIVVDNCSDQDVAKEIAAEFPDVEVLRLPQNVGTEGRNAGMKRAFGEIAVCLDDDVMGIDDEAIKTLRGIFENTRIAGVCFKVLNPLNGGICNWSHHYDADRFADQTFPTNEITEGAVAFRRSAFLEAGGYPGMFFISHEGPDLACRLMDRGYDIIYSPEIAVTHYHSPVARKNWRRYYYDTRNSIWLALRNFPAAYGLKYCAIAVGSMMAYSLRDGFFRYWLKAIRDAFRAWPDVSATRRRLGPSTMAKIREIESHRPSLFVMIRKRLLRKGVGI